MPFGTHVDMIHHSCLSSLFTHACILYVCQCVLFCVASMTYVCQCVLFCVVPMTYMCQCVLFCVVPMPMTGRRRVPLVPEHGVPRRLVDRALAALPESRLRKPSRCARGLAMSFDTVIVYLLLGAFKRLFLYLIPYHFIH